MHWPAIVFSPVIGLLITCGAWAQTSSVLYRDSNWGVVRQNDGKTCIIVLNTDDRQHAFHFLIDGAQGEAKIGILQSFLPDSAYITSGETVIDLDLGPGFARRLMFRPGVDGMSKFIAADFKWHELDHILSALENMGGADMSFPNGANWHVRPPERKSAGPAIDACWKGAMKGYRLTSLATWSW